MTVALPELIEKARKQLGEFTGLPLGSTISARKDKRGWCVQVEVVEKKSIPDGQDILATYELTVDEGADVLDFARVGMRKRVDAVTLVGADLEV